MQVSHIQTDSVIGWCSYVGYDAGLSEELPETVKEENVKKYEEGEEMAIYTVDTLQCCYTFSRIPAY